MAAYIGIIFDLVSENIVERGTVERATEDEAYDDAVELCKVMGFDEADAYVYDQEMHCVIYEH